jgi:hypothetical protein
LGCQLLEEKRGDYKRRPPSAKYNHVKKKMEGPSLMRPSTGCNFAKLTAHTTSQHKLPIKVKKNRKSKLNIGTANKGSIGMPNIVVLWIRIQIQWGPWIRIRIQEGKNEPKT